MSSVLEAFLEKVKYLALIVIALISAIFIFYVGNFILQSLDLFYHAGRSMNLGYIYGYVQVYVNENVFIAVQSVDPLTVTVKYNTTSPTLKLLVDDCILLLGQSSYEVCGSGTYDLSDLLYGTYYIMKWEQSAFKTGIDVLNTLLQILLPCAFIVAFIAILIYRRMR